MNKIYCVPSLYNRIDLFEKFLKQLDSSDTVYCLGNFGFNAMQQTSQVTYYYFYNLIHQQNTNLPQIKLIKGRRETPLHFKAKFITQLTLNTLPKYIQNMNLSTVFKPNQKVPTPAEFANFFANLESYYIINDKFVLVANYIEPTLSLDKQILDPANEESILQKHFIKIPDAFYQYCLKNKLTLHSKKAKQAFLKSPKNFYSGFSDLMAYNSALSTNFANQYIFVFGDGYDANYTKSLAPIQLSNIICLDGGLGRSMNDETWFYYETKDEQLNVLEISGDECKILTIK